MQNEVQVRQ